MSYRIEFEIKGFAGYHLWRVRVRQKPKQRWRDATLYAGRTDTEAQAWGEVANLVAGASFAAINLGQTSWPEIREHLRQPDERRRFEGVGAWEQRKTELGSDGLDALADEGRRFLDGWLAECKRRDDERREAYMNDVAFAVFCNATGRDFRDHSAEAWAAFLRWRVDEAERKSRQDHGGFQFNFIPDTRAADLATLGLSTNANADDIKAAWRRAAMRLHPDRGGDHQQFVAAKAAFERLTGITRGKAA
jgi:hypothetical protein